MKIKDALAFAVQLETLADRLKEGDKVPVKLTYRMDGKRYKLEGTLSVERIRKTGF